MMNLMTPSQTHTQKHNPSQKRNKRRLTEDQLSLLESSFNANKKLEPERKQQLARELGIPPRQIAIWYQNKRARWKNQSLELDYSTLQLRLDATLAEKRQLQREVDWLRAELHNAQQTAAALQQAAAAGHQYHQHQLSSCDDVGSSSLSLAEDVICSANHEQNEQQHHQVLQVEELYACLMGTDQFHGLFAPKKHFL